MNSKFNDGGMHETILLKGRYLNFIGMFNIQSIYGAPQNLRENAHIVLCKRINDKREAIVLEQLMNFSNEEQEAYMMSMPIHEGIFINKEKGSVPVPLFIPLYPTRIISDDEIHAYQERVIERITGNVVREKPAREESSQSSDGEPSYQGKLVIEDLRRFPFDFQSEREERLNINRRIISEILEQFVNKGFLKKYEKKMNLGRGKGQFQLYLFTEKAEALYGKQAIKGKGSVEHAFWQYRVAKHYQMRGFETEVEYFLEDGRHSIDVVAQRNGERIAIEIELNDTPHIVDNIRKCLKVNFDQVRLAVYDQKLMKRLNQFVLRDEYLEGFLRQEKIVLKYLSDFLE